MKYKLLNTLFFFLPFLLAFPFHFGYEYLKFPPLAIYLPVNESVFEHTKLTFTPFIISYLLFYFYKKKKLKTLMMLQDAMKKNKNLLKLLIS